MSTPVRDLRLNILRRLIRAVRRLRSRCSLKNINLVESFTPFREFSNFCDKLKIFLFVCVGYTEDKAL